MLPLNPPDDHEDPGYPERAKLPDAETKPGAGDEPVPGKAPLPGKPPPPVQPERLAGSSLSPADDAAP